MKRKNQIIGQFSARLIEMLESPALVASALEFILEGRHLNKKLNKKVLEGEISYWG